MERDYFTQKITRYFKTHPVVALLGPRQCGKTTLARVFSKKEPVFPKTNYFDLESPIDVERLKNPLLTLRPLSGLIVIDEIQRFPELFKTLRVLIDDEELDQHYLILGSASPDLIQQSSESLAGRIAYIELPPFSFLETQEMEKLWSRGGFPKSFLARTAEESFDWRSFYVRTFLEQDIPNLGIKIPPPALRRFWTMLAHYHGAIFNASEIGRSFGASDITMRRYLDILTGTFMIRQLQPWHANIGKRQVKSPKIFFRDSGILHSLLQIHDFEQLQLHPKLGASWEGFAIQEILTVKNMREEECFFWSTYHEAEIDLIVQEKGELIGIEVKYTDAPTITKSMQIALKDLELKHIYVVYPGSIDYPLSDKITVKGLRNFLASSHD